MIRQHHNASKALLLSGAFVLLGLSACRHAPPSVVAAPVLTCDGHWEACLERDLDQLAELRRMGAVEPWTQALVASLRRTPIRYRAILHDLFMVPDALLTPSQALRIQRALASRIGADVASIGARAAGRRLRETWQNQPTTALSVGRVTQWLMVSGYEAERGAALTRIDPPQRRFGPGEVFQTPLGDRRVRSVAIAPTRSTLFPQDWTYPSQERCSHFAAAFTVSQAARLSLHGGDESRIWVDGRAVLELRGLENKIGTTIDLGLALPPGQHQVEMRSCPRFGSGSFALYVHDGDGKLLPIEDAPFSPRRDELPSIFKPFNAKAMASRPYADLKSQRLKHLLTQLRLARLGQGPDALAGLSVLAGSPLTERWIALGLAQASRRKEAQMAMVDSLGDDGLGRVHRARALAELGQSDRAAKLVLPRLAELKTMNRFEKLVVLELAGQKAPAGELLRLWRQISNEDPQWSEARRRVAKWLQAAQRVAAADRMEEALVDQHLGGLAALQTAKDRAQRRGRYDDALAISDRILAFDRLDAGEQLARVDLLHRAERGPEAEAALDRLLAQNPFHVGALWRRAAALRGDEGPDAAAPFIARLKAVSPEHRQVIRSERYAALQQPTHEFRSPFWHRPTAQEIATLVANRTAHRPDQAVSQVLLMDDHLDLIQPDGSRRQVVTLVRWLLDRRSAQQFLKINLAGLRNRQIHHAYMVRPNGERVDPVSMRNGEIRFREMVAGSALVLQYESTQKRSNVLTGLVSGAFFFEGSDNFAVTSRYTLAIARPDLQPKFNLIGAAPKRAHGEHDGVRVWSFLRQNVAPAAMERLVQAPWRYRSQVRFSTMQSWGPYVAWVRDLFRQAGKVTDGVAAKAKSLTHGLKEASQKVDAIYAFAVDKIQYEQDYARVIEGWEPHLPDQVLERGYGDCKDKTMLIVTMLSSLGIDAHPALIRTWSLGDLDKSLPSSQFNHAVVWLPAQDGIPKGRFLDATAEYLDRDNLRLDIQATDALVIAPNDWSFRRVPSRPATEERLDAELTYAGDNTWRVSLGYRGRAAGMIRQVGKGQKRQFLLESLGARMFWPGTTLTSGRLDDSGKRLKILLELKAPEGTIGADGHLQTPELMLRPFGSWFEKQERKLDLRVGNTRHVNLVLDLPNHRIQAGPPLKFNEHGVAGALTCGANSCRFVNIIEPLVLSPEAYARAAAVQRRFSAEIKARQLMVK